MRKTAQWPSGRYVVGIDGSPQSNRALAHAVRLAVLTGAHVDAVTVWEDPNSYQALVATAAWSPEAAASVILHDAVKAVLGSDIPEWVSLEILRGNTAAALIRESRNADLLIVGSRGHGGFAGLLLGSVSSTCAEHAKCPVLVVHGTRTLLPDPASRAALDL